MRREFGDVLTAMVTPFDRDLNVDYARARELALRLVGSGSDGLVVAGTTGESPTVTREEKLRLFEAVVDAIGDKATVVAGTGSYNTRESIELSREAEKVGVHGLLLVVPYYNKPPQEGLFRHFAAVAEATSLPCMLYNIPGRTGVNMAPETVARLASLSNITAVKEASGVMDQVTEIRRRTPPSFQIYSGDDSLTLPILSLGGTGVVSVASHVAGGMIREMIRAFKGGETGRAAELNARLFPLFRAMFVTTNPIPVKEALRLSGFDCGGVRLPLVGCDEGQSKAVRDAMAALGLLAA